MHTVGETVQVLSEVAVENPRVHPEGGREGPVSSFEHNPHVRGWYAFHAGPSNVALLIWLHWWSQKNAQQDRAPVDLIGSQFNSSMIVWLKRWTASQMGTISSIQPNIQWDWKGSGHFLHQYCETQIKVCLLAFWTFPFVSISLRSLHGSFQNYQRRLTDWNGQTTAIFSILLGFLWFGTVFSG